MALTRYSDVAATYAFGPYYPFGYQGNKVPPIIGSTGPNITCGRWAFDSASRTETADVLAGSEVGFRVSADGYSNRNNSETRPLDAPPYPTFWHPGPAQVYLSRAPNDDLQSYRGDSDWFKIGYGGPTNDTHWSLWPSVSDVRCLRRKPPPEIVSGRGAGLTGRLQMQFNFTIPKTTPPGKYLMRMENFVPTAQTGYLQFYVNCAFVNIIGPGGGTPTEFARFPGTYQDEDPGKYLTLSY